MLNLPEMEVAKLNGLHFRCECCGHINLLKDLKFHKAMSDKLSYNALFFEDFISMQSKCI